jgi:predicted nucleotidyltransferase component of viral defense system
MRSAMQNRDRHVRRTLAHEEVRRLAITAVFSDDYFFDRVVLKGGNALAIALGISGRSSLDLDFSIERDFENPAEAAQRLEAALQALAWLYLISLLPLARSRRAREHQDGAGT